MNTIQSYHENAATVVEKAYNDIVRGGVGLVLDRSAAASDTCMPHKTFAESNADGADANIEIGVCVAWHSIVPHISKH